MSTPHGSVKQRSFLMSFPSFFFLSLSVCLSNKGNLLMIFPSFSSARGVCGRGGGCSHIRAVRVCDARKPPIFRPGPLLKPPRFRPGPHRKTPLFKNIHLFVPLFRHGLLQKTPLLKVYVSLLFLVPTTTPRFSSRGRSESPPFSVRGRSLISPNSGRHIYIYIYHFHIWVHPTGLSNKGHF